MRAAKLFLHIAGSDEKNNLQRGSAMEINEEGGE